MNHRFIRILSALSLAICIATVLLWITGYSWIPSAVWQRTTPVTETHYTVSIAQGSFQLDRLSPPSDPPPQEHDGLLGFGFSHCPGYAIAENGPNHLVCDSLSIFIPYWFIILLTAALPLAWAIPMLRARFIIPPGHCRACGYDLCATPERCPECGAVATAMPPHC